MNGYKKQNRTCFKKKVKKIRDNNTPSTNEASTASVRKHRKNKRLTVSVPFKLPRSTRNS